MKFWLYDILACPIDKHYPLKLFIFSYDTKSEEINTLIDILKQRDIDIIENEEVIITEMKNDEFFLKDAIILEKTKLNTYLQLIIRAINEFNNIYDNSSNQLTKLCLKIIKNEIKPVIEKFMLDINPNKIQGIFPELYFLNKIKLNLEIDSGILYCAKCNRWYPIIETIPQMLPDEFRKEEEEVKFLKSIRNLLDDKFFQQDLKPFNL